MAVIAQQAPREAEVIGTFTVLNDRGLHTRPATELVKRATSYRSTILLRHRDMEVNAKSLLGVLTLMATRGTRIKMKATGPDAQKAVDGLKDLADGQFNIKY